MTKFVEREAKGQSGVRFTYKYRVDGGTYHVSRLRYLKAETGDADEKRIDKDFSNEAQMIKGMDIEAERYFRKAFGETTVCEKGSITFKEFNDLFFYEIAADKDWEDYEGSTRGVYYNAIYNQLAPKFDKTPIKDITAIMCQNVVDQCEAEYKEAYTSDRKDWLRNVIRHVLEYAEALKYIDKSPLERSKPGERLRERTKKVTAAKIHPKSISIPDLQNLLTIIKRHVPHDGRYMVMAIMMFLGPRDSAAAGLRFCEIIKNGESDIYSALIKNQTTDEGQLKDGQKWGRGIPHVPVLPELMELIEKRKAYIRELYPDISEEKLNTLTIASKKDDVFTSCSQKDIDEVTKELFKEANITIGDLIVPVPDSMQAEGVKRKDESPTAYAFRRNFSSMLYDLVGLEDDEAMYLMGHSREHSSSNSDIDYSSPSQQMALYEKLKKISDALNEANFKEIMLNDENIMSYCKNETKVYVTVHLNKGDIVSAIINACEPHDKIMMIARGEKRNDLQVKAKLLESEGKYQNGGTNIMGYLAEGFKRARPRIIEDDDPDKWLFEVANSPDADGFGMPDYDEKEWEKIETCWDEWIAEAEDTEEAQEAEERETVEEAKATEGNVYIVVLTNKGYIFRFKEEWIPEQNPNTKGKKVINVARLGEPIAMLLAEDDACLAAISSEGIRYKIPVSSIRCPGDIMELWHGSEREFGYSPCEGENETISHICIMPVKEQEDIKFVLTTNSGGIAKIAKQEVLSRYRKKKVIKLRHGEVVSGSLWCSDDDNLIIMSSGHAFAQSVEQVPERANVSGTVRGILCMDGVRCIGLAHDEGLLATISSDGLGKATEACFYHPNDDIAQVFNRGVLGKQANVLSEGHELITGLTVNEAGYLYLASSDGLILKIDSSGVPVSSRVTKGNKLMKLSKGSRVCCATWRDV